MSCTHTHTHENITPRQLILTKPPCEGNISGTPKEQDSGNAHTQRTCKTGAEGSSPSRSPLDKASHVALPSKAPRKQALARTLQQPPRPNPNLCAQPHITLPPLPESGPLSPEPPPLFNRLGSRAPRGILPARGRPKGAPKGSPRSSQHVATPSPPSHRGPHSPRPQQQL